MRRGALGAAVVLSGLMLTIGLPATAAYDVTIADTPQNVGGYEVSVNDSTYVFPDGTSLDIRDELRDNGLLPLGWADFEGPEECVPKGSCPQLNGEAFVHADISSVMDDYTSDARFRVVNGLETSMTTLWFVCSYDDTGWTLNCWYDSERDWGMAGKLSPDARELRLFPVQSSLNQYYLDVDVR